ncbi:MAG TPA: hypothetical protein VLD86_18480, partial [Ilumatobacteraceae bacterium]|nr:hypothetical protein [Ilumatobacteraceae bacterium]
MAIVVPLVVALISVSRERWYPTGDMAQAELHVRGFFGHPPLIGAAGRIGTPFVPYGQGSHPGPALWVALLPVYRLAGQSSFGIELGMTLLQLAFIVATVLIVRRLFGPIGGLVVAAIAATLVHALRPAPFIEPWNPWGALFAFFCFVALCWGVLLGRHRCLPAAAFAGFFAVQCHVGYALLIGVTLAALVGWVLWQWRRAGDADADAGSRLRGAILRSGAFTIAVTVLMWLPPLIDQLRRRPGNLRILWRHFTASSNPDGSARSYVGVVAALKAFAGEFAVPGPWIRGAFREPYDRPNLLTFLLAVGMTTAIVVALIRQRAVLQRNALIRLFILLGGLMILGIVSTVRIFGEFFEYVIRWWWILVAWTVAACLLALARLGRERWVLAIAVVLGLTMSSLATADAFGEQNPGPRNSRLVGGVAPQVADHLDHDAHYLVRWLDPGTLGGVPFGLVLELEKEGFHVGVDAVYAAGSLPHRVLPESSATAVLWVVLGQPNIDMMRARTDAVELGSFDQRSPVEIAESKSLREQLIVGLRERGLDCVIATIDAQYGLAQFMLGTAAAPPDLAELA